MFQRSFWSLSLAATIVMVSSSTSYGVPHTQVMVEVIEVMAKAFERVAAANKNNPQFKNYMTKIGTKEFNTQLNQEILKIKDPKSRNNVTEYFSRFSRFSAGIRDMGVGVGVGSVYTGKNVYDVCNVDKPTREQCSKLLIRWYNKCNSNSNRKFQMKKETDCPKMN
jgi:hypothetical protein